MAEETPVITQYLGIKKQHPNDVLFFRLGDFYEMFNEDAVEVSRRSEEHTSELQSRI